MVTYEEKLNRNVTWALEEGGMHFERRSEVHDTLQRVTRKLEDLGIDYAVAGAMGMFLHGFHRFTEDVDIIVTREGLQQVHDALRGRGYLPPFEKSKNLRDTTTGVRIDFIISGQYPGEGNAGPVDFPIPSEASVVIDGIRVVSLPKLVELKLASGQVPHRLSDLGDVRKMIGALKLPRDFAEQIDPSLRDSYYEMWEHAKIVESEDF